MTIHIRQSVEKKSPKYWSWHVWLDGSNDELDGIRSVVYQLHPTFKKPIREIHNRETGFRLDSSGWGQFMIYITIYHKHGSDEKRKHYLQFSTEAPSKKLEGKLGEKFKDRPPTAFLSYSVADAMAAKKVRERLEAKGVSVLDASSIEIGGNLNDGITKMIDQSDFGVSIMSDITSDWVNQESLQMKQHKLPVFQVESGSAYGAPNNELKILSLDQSDATDFSNLIDSALKSR